MQVVEKALWRGYRRQRLYGGLRSALRAGVVVVAGAVVGVLLVYPLLPEAAADVMIELQQLVSRALDR